MRLLLLVLASCSAALTFAMTADAHRPINCSKLSPSAELRCAKHQLHHARKAARNGTRHHSHAYWLWRERVARRWIKNAHYLLSLHLRSTGDWQIAVRRVQRTWPGTAAWMLSCSAHEGGHGSFVMNRQGSLAGGWMQYMQGTFDSHYSNAVALARSERLPVPPPGEGWTTPLGQAFAAGWGYHFNRSAWAGDPYC